MILKSYGWRPDKPDARDKIYEVPATASLPHSVDLRQAMPPVYNQGELGSCTANAIAAAIDYEHGRNQRPFINPSRLFIYYFERRLEGTIESDAGAEIRDGIKVVNADGVPPESLWPYDITKFRERPAQAILHEAKSHQALKYLRLAEDGQSFHYRHALAQGFPVIFGFTVYDSFEGKEIARSGLMRSPDFDRENVRGGHAVLGVGYFTNDVLTTFFSDLPNGTRLEADPGGGYAIVRNSWATDWGIDGYFFMPFSFLFNTNLATDFWTIREME
jgi:C1A family cysteine protease